MYKVSPSLLDSFDIVQKGIFDKPVEDLIASIKREFVPGPAMEFGTAVHEFIETGDMNLLHPNTAMQLIPFYEKHKGTAKEVKIRPEIFPGIKISMMADELHGVHIGEFKTGSRFYGHAFYDRSPQWKFYLMGFEARRMVYYHFLYRKPSVSAFPVKFPVLFTGFKCFDYYPYKGMEQEMKNLCIEFIEFCKVHNLEQYITIED